MANVEGLNPELRARVQALINASGGRIFIKSGYRSPEHQARLVEAAKKKHGANWRKWVAPAGKSNHNHGEAVDLGGDLKLAHKLAPAHNLSFPMGWEPWHAQRAEFKSKAGSLTSKPTTSMGLPTNATASAQYQERIAPQLATTTIGAEATTEDRHDIGTQISSLLNILDKPIDFEGKVA